MNKGKLLLKKIITGIPFLVLFVILVIIGSGIYGFFNLGSNMKVGQKFMENLNDSQLLYWINDAITLHSIDSLRAIKIGAKSKYRNNLEKKYMDVGILRIDISDHAVSYVWMGGFDHTWLSIGFRNDSIINVMACYDDNTRQLLYPKLEEVYSNADFKYIKNKGNKILTGKLKISTDKTILQASPK